MSFDEMRDPEDRDAIDPEDVEVEVETEDEEEEVKSEENDDSEIPEEESLDDEMASDDEDIEVPSLNEAGPTEADLAEDTVELAQYRITGLVDYTDEQGNIVGRLPKDSIQELPVIVGDKAVEAGQAERV